MSDKELREYVIKKWQRYSGETVEEAMERIKAKRKRFNLKRKNARRPKKN